jgi:hypothetical protein
MTRQVNCVLTLSMTHHDLIYISADLNGKQSIVTPDDGQSMISRNIY